MASLSSILTKISNLLIGLAILFLTGVLLTAIIDAIRFVLRRRTALRSSAAPGHRRRRASQPKELESAVDLVTDVVEAPLGVMLRAVRGAALFILQLCLAIPLLLLRLAFGIGLVSLVMSFVAPPTAEESAALSAVLGSVLKPQNVPEYANAFRAEVLDAVGRNTVGVRYKTRNNAWDQLVSAVLEFGDCTWTPSPWAADSWRGTSDCTKAEREVVKIGGGGNTCNPHPSPTSDEFRLFPGRDWH